MLDAHHRGWIFFRGGVHFRCNGGKPDATPSATRREPGALGDADTPAHPFDNAAEGQEEKPKAHGWSVARSAGLTPFPSPPEPEGREGRNPEGRNLTPFPSHA